jgi:hypothetical protein
MSTVPFPPPGAPPPGPQRSGSAGNGGNGHRIRADDWDADAAREAFDARVESGDYNIPPPNDDDWDWDVQAAEQAASAAAEFTQGAPADVMAPGPMLAAIAHDAASTVAAGTGAEVLAGVRGLSDNQLAGMIGAGDRISSWGASLKIAATAELADRRRTGEPAAIRAGQATSEFAAD